ncbi:transposase [Streptomyces sp. Qhu-G9]|nr:transposase [Streptomyces aurantiacus]WAU82480.1 transposase [Streptomyces aurantiacus]
MSRIACRFSRVEPRRRVRRLVSELLSDLSRRNCWTLAEHAGDATPDGMQHLLHRAKWDADAIRDDIRAYVVEHLRNTEAVLLVNETGDLKKGTATVGVQRQYTGTAGRVENAQVTVYLVYSSSATQRAGAPASKARSSSDPVEPRASRGRVRDQPSQETPSGRHAIQQARGPRRGDRPHRSHQRVAVTLGHHPAGSTFHACGRSLPQKTQTKSSSRTMLCSWQPRHRRNTTSWVNPDGRSSPTSSRARATSDQEPMSGQ